VVSSSRATLGGGCASRLQQLQLGIAPLQWGLEVSRQKIEIQAPFAIGLSKTK
jgi:hypothetical protein